MIEYEDVEEDAAVVICAPTSAPHVAEVSVRQCDFCGAEVWLAKSTETALPEKYYLMCIECAAAHKVGADEVIQMPNDDQIRDIAKELNIPFEEAKAGIIEMMNARNRSSQYGNN